MINISRDIARGDVGAAESRYGRNRRRVTYVTGGDCIASPDDGPTKLVGREERRKRRWEERGRPLAVPPTTSSPSLGSPTGTLPSGTIH
jgi:hypothetical protein